MRRGKYGFDAPYALATFAGATAIAGIGSLTSLLRGSHHTALVVGFYFLVFLANTGSFWYTTRYGKFIEWARILEHLKLRGDEAVLDMGCGRGAVLTGVARKLTTGHVTGVDIWNTMDQSGNAREVTLRNASLEGVSDRVQIETGDMRSLPFQHASFDVVVSSLAIHNIRSNDERRKAVAEGFRVLKPGGRMVLVDIRAVRLYARELQTLGAANVERRRLSWRFWWGNPLAATSLVSASKAPQVLHSGIPS